jgi:hypothetical protein
MPHEETITGINTSSTCVHELASNPPIIQNIISLIDHTFAIESTNVVSETKSDPIATPARRRV